MADTATAGAELEKWSPTAEQLDLAEKVILGEAELPVAADKSAVSRSIMERILEAESFEEAFSARKLESWRDLEGVPVTVLSWHLNASTAEEGDDGGAGVYAVVDLERGDDGERLTVTCGGTNVLAQLVTMTRKGWLDRAVKLTSQRTQAGYSALWLESA